MMRRRLLAGSFLVAALVTSCSAADTDGEDPIEISSEPYDEAGIDAWGQAYEVRETGKGDDPGCSGVLVPDQSGFGGRVALTFDDGPEPASTTKVLDILAEHGIKATFFINGKRVDTQADRDVLARIIRDGHLLANHSQNHLNLKEQDLAKVEAEVDNTHKVIEQAGAPPTYFRFPFGSSSCSTADLVRSFGYRVTGWHTDSADWCFASSTGGVGFCDSRTFKHVPDSLRDDMVGLVLEQVQRKNGGIVLFHDVHMNTANNLDLVIRTLKEKEFVFVNVDDASTFPALNSADIEDFPWVGSLCQDTSECDFSDTANCFTYDNDGMQAGFCTSACEGFCDDFPGRAPTFCVSLDGGETGSCVSKAADQNQQCAALPGTQPVMAERFVGSSNAPASTATVCLPQ